MTNLVDQLRNPTALQLQKSLSLAILDRVENQSKLILWQKK